MPSPETNANPAPAPERASPHFPAWFLAIVLVLATVALYWPATRCDFVNFDDQSYVTANFHVQAGLNWAGVKWAFANPVEVNWHPLTVMTHMLDCQLFGLNPWGHHLVNVLLHSLNAALVFVWLRQLTGATGRSFLVAALFAFHPLNVESVAWVSELKNVLSGCFGLLALIFYTRYAQKRSTVASPLSEAGAVPVSAPQSVTRDYLLTLFFLALGLLSKPTLVTWPFVMLLLDWWPLIRIQNPKSKIKNFQCLVLEKIPFFVLVAVDGLVTYLVQKQAGAVAGGNALSLGARGGNALVSYCRYLGKMVWPTDLAVFYPHPGHWPLVTVLLAGGLLAVISALVIVNRRRHPFLLMGWLWFGGTLVPMIGVVQSGAWAMADRQTYIPSLGLLILAIWGANEVMRHWRHSLIASSAAGLVVIGLCMGLTRQQLGYWQDSETLFSHAVAVTENNPFARDNLGSALLSKGSFDEAISQFREAIRLKPDDVEASFGLGIALDRKGQTDAAISQYQETIRMKPDFAEAYNNLGIALDGKGQTGAAISQYQEAIRLKPDFAQAYNNLGMVLDRKGQTDEAMSQYQKAVQMNPDYADGHYNLANSLNQKGQIAGAISEYEEAIALKPDFADAYDNLGVAFGKVGQIDEAISQFQEAVRLKPDDADAQNNLKRALAIKKK